MADHARNSAYEDPRVMIPPYLRASRALSVLGGLLEKMEFSLLGERSRAGSKVYGWAFPLAEDLELRIEIEARKMSDGSVELGGPRDRSWCWVRQNGPKDEYAPTKPLMGWMVGFHDEITVPFAPVPDIPNETELLRRLMGVVALRKRKAVRDFQKFKNVSEEPSRASEETAPLEPGVTEETAPLEGGLEPVSFYFEPYGDNRMVRELQTGLEVLTETRDGGTVTGKVEKFVPERGDEDEARYVLDGMDRQVWADEVFLR